jgi:hypothetical protein
VVLNITEIKILVGLVCSKLFDLLLSVKTTLPALLSAMGAPLWSLSLIAPIREGGALLPQAWLSIKLALVKSRHIVWVLGVSVQIIISVIIYMYVPLSDWTYKTYLILFLLLIASLARSVISLTSKDIQAKNIEKGKRGSISGIASSISGACLLAIAILSMLTSFDSPIEKAFTYCLIACMCLCIGLLFMGSVYTEIDIEKNTVKGKQATLVQVLRAMPRKAKQFIIVRSLLVNSAIAAPFFISLGGQNILTSLPLYLIAQASASMLSSYLWGRFADKNSVVTMQVSAIMCATFILSFSSLVIFKDDLPSTLNFSYISSLLFFGLCVGHAGIRQGRKVFMLDAFEEQQRTEFVGLVNTIIGIVLLAFGGIYALLYALPSVYLLLIMSALIVFASIRCEDLKQAL